MNSPGMLRFDFLAACLLWPMISLQAQSRFAIPDTASLETAEQSLRKNYVSEFARARKPSEKLALASQFFKEADAPSNTPDRLFALLTLVRQLAIDAGDAELAFSVDARIERDFDANRADQQYETATTLLKSAAGPAEKQTIARLLRPVMVREFSANYIDRSHRGNQILEQIARDTNDTREVKACAERRALIEDILKNWWDFEEANKVIQARPDDAAGNSYVGQFLLFRKGYWAPGLYHVVRGDDEVLKELARRDIARPRNPADQLILADAWWDAAAARPELERRGMRRRAMWWYIIAAPSLTGLDSRRVEERIAGRDRTAVDMLLEWRVPSDSLIGDAILALPFHTASQTGTTKSTVLDVSGRSQSVSPRGGMWQPAGLAGGGYQFEGAAVDDPAERQPRLELGQKLTGFPLNDFSLSVWFRAEQSSGAIIGSGQSESWPREWYLAPGGFFWRWSAAKDAGGSEEAKAGVPVPTFRHRWHHIAVTRQKNRVTVYVDGLPAGESTSFPANTPLPIYDTGLMIGNVSRNTGKTAEWNPYAGLIDELGIWPRTLSPWEVGLLYRAGRARQSFANEEK